LDPEGGGFQEYWLFPGAFAIELGVEHRRLKGHYRAATVEGILDRLLELDRAAAVDRDAAAV
jgi:hypothetical protein